MAVTTNVAPTDAWKFVASGPATVSVGSKYIDIETLNHNSNSTAPSADLEGYKTDAGDVNPVQLQTGDHLWMRINQDRSGTSDADPVAVITIQTS